MDRAEFERRSEGERKRMMKRLAEEAGGKRTSVVAMLQKRVREKAAGNGEADEECW